MPYKILLPYYNSLIFVAKLKLLNMGKAAKIKKDKPVFSSDKCPKVWEKARRERLKVLFEELSKLLPKHDPAVPPSRPEIITKAIAHIRELQAQNEELLNGGFDKVYKKRLETWKKRVKNLLCRVEQLSNILRTANIHVPPVAVDGLAKWPPPKPKFWTDKIKLPEEKVQEIVKQLSQTKKTMKKSKKELKTIVEEPQTKENQPIVDGNLIEPMGKKQILVLPQKKILPISSVPQVTGLFQAQPLTQPGTFLLTNQGNLVPLLTPTPNVLTPLIINGPPPLVVLQTPSQPRALPVVLSKPPLNKRRIERETTVMTFANKRPISALSRQSHSKKEKCAAHKNISNQTIPTSSESLQAIVKLNNESKPCSEVTTSGLTCNVSNSLVTISAVSPTAAFLNSFPVVTASLTADEIVTSNVNQETSIKSTESTEKWTNQPVKEGANKVQEEGTKIEDEPLTSTGQTSAKTASETSVVPITTVLGSSNNTVSKVGHGIAEVTTQTTWSYRSILTNDSKLVSSSATTTHPLHQPGSAISNLMQTAPTHVPVTDAYRAILTNERKNVTNSNVEKERSQYSLQPGSCSTVSAILTNERKNVTNSNVEKERSQYSLQPGSCSTVSNLMQSATAMASAPTHVPLLTNEKKNVKTSNADREITQSFLQSGSCSTVSVILTNEGMNVTTSNAEREGTVSLLQPASTSTVNNFMQIASTTATSHVPDTGAYRAILTNERKKVTTSNADREITQSSLQPASSSTVNNLMQTPTTMATVPSHVPVTDSYSTNEGNNVTTSKESSLLLPQPSSICSTTSRSSICGPTLAIPHTHVHATSPASSYRAILTNEEKNVTILNAKKESVLLNLKCSTSVQCSTMTTPTDSSCSYNTNENVHRESTLPLLQPSSTTSSSLAGEFQPIASTVLTTHTLANNSTWASHTILTNDIKSSNVQKASTLPLLQPGLECSVTSSSSASNFLRTVSIMATTHIQAPDCVKPTKTPNIDVPKSSVMNYQSPIESTSKVTWSTAKPQYTSAGVLPSFNGQDTEISCKIMQASNAPSQYTTTPSISSSSLLSGDAAALTFNNVDSLSMAQYENQFTNPPILPINKEVEKKQRNGQELESNVYETSLKPTYFPKESTVNNANFASSVKTSTPAWTKGSLVCDSSGTENKFPCLPNPWPSGPQMQQKLKFNLELPSSKPSNSCKTNYPMNFPTSWAPIPVTCADGLPTSENSVTTQWMALPTVYGDKSCSTWRPIPPDPVWTNAPSITDAWKVPDATFKYPEPYDIRKKGTYNGCEPPSNNWPAAIPKSSTSVSSKSNNIYINSPGSAKPRAEVNTWNCQPETNKAPGDYAAKTVLNSPSQGQYICPDKTSEKNKVLEGVTSSLAPIIMSSSSFSSSDNHPFSVNTYSTTLMKPSNVPSYQPLVTLESSYSTKPSFGLDVPKTLLGDQLYPFSTSKAASTESGLFYPANAAISKRCDRFYPENTCGPPRKDTKAQQTYSREVKKQVHSSEAMEAPNNLWNVPYAPPQAEGLAWHQTTEFCAGDSKSKGPINWMTDDQRQEIDENFHAKYQNVFDRRDHNVFDFCFNSSEDDLGKGKGKKREETDYFGWLPMKMDPLVVPSTLPTLVGDLALGGDPPPPKKMKMSQPFRPEKPNDLDSHPQEPFANLSNNIFESQNESSKTNLTETVVLKNIFELPAPPSGKLKTGQGQNTFLSVSQLVEPHDVCYNPRTSSKNKRGTWKCSDKKLTPGKCVNAINSNNYSTEALLRNPGPEVDLPQSNTPLEFPMEFAPEASMLESSDLHHLKVKSCNQVKNRSQEFWKVGTSSAEVIPSFTHHRPPGPLYLDDSYMSKQTRDLTRQRRPYTTGRTKTNFPYQQDVRKIGKVENRTIPSYGTNPPPPNVLLLPNPVMSTSLSQQQLKQGEILTYQGKEQLDPCGYFPKPSVGEEQLQGSTFPTFTPIPPPTPGASGSSLPNFNFTTIFPEMNKKRFQYS